MVASGAAAPAIDATDVVYRYGAGAPALDGVTLTTAPGSLVALLGPNGSGKSTFLRLAARLDRPHSGAIRIMGEEEDSAVRRRVGVVFQSPSLDPRLSPRENLAAHAALQGVDPAATRERVAAVLATLRLLDRADVPVRTLSMGLARRVDLARALLHAPDVLLLDEPTTGLDPAARASFLETVRAEQRGRGASILMSTHLVDEAESADRVVLMHHGRIVADGSPTALRSQLGPRLVTVTGDAPPSGAANWTRRGEAWVAAPAGEAAASSLCAALLAAGRAFSVAPPTLADLFATLTGEELAPRRSAEGEGGADGR